MLLPRLAVVGAQDDNLSLPAAQRGEMRHLDDHRAAGRWGWGQRSEEVRRGG